jgi:nucleotide-binding universal stress UspA family protein
MNAPPPALSEAEGARAKYLNHPPSLSHLPLRKEARMPVITNILFPVDFSPASAAMAPYVKRAAAIFSARVSLIHVFDPASYNGFELYLRPESEIAPEHEKIARDRLDTFLADEFPPSQYPRILAAGDAATRIAQAARDGFDLIIMPTHAGSFRRMLLGSTTAKVLDSADCPVLTGQHAVEVAPRPINHREWLCAIGLGENSERVLSYARQATEEVRAALQIIHAIPSADPGLPIQLDLEEHLQSQERRQARARINELQHRAGLNVPIRIAVGPIKDALLHAASSTDADVLIMGRSPQLGSEGRLRDLTYAIVRDSSIPVLSV